jgi:uncharacterized membrane protein YhaH (DUF805 family)
MLKRAIVGTFDYSGRSQRTEVAIVWIVGALALGVVSGFSGLLESPNDRLAHLALSIGAMVPVFCLFARRMHDQDRSGWWVLLLVLFTMLSIYQRLEATLLTPPPELASRLPALPGWVDVIGVALWLPMMVFTIAPGTDGPNRFGPDPRRSIHPEQLRARDQQDEAERTQDPLLR